MAATTPAPTTRRRPPAARRAPARPPAARAVTIRWDRVGRLALLVLLFGVVCLYVGPAHSWYSAWRDARHKRAEVAHLRAEHASLLARRRELSQPSALEREARTLGMVRRGEVAYVVERLPARRR